ncbi:MAG TPA: hypothetical protein VEF76_05415 [Patescibacteria group bacterium]|nr:hypothetical protein [Patescibacteria group bacterium]
MADPASFTDKAKPFFDAAARITRSGDTFTIPADVVELFRQQTAKTDGADFAVALFSRLDTDISIAIARSGGAPWWQPFTGKVFAGDLAGARKVWDNATAAQAKPNATSAMTWISHPYTATGIANKTDAAMLRQLFDWGADVNEKNGEWLEKAVRTLDGDALKEFVTRGNVKTVFRAMENLGDAQRAKIQRWLQKPVTYVKVDDSTLSETKFIPDPQGGATFRTLFNFSARRISEIYEYGADRKALMTTAGFDDYDSAAIDVAREKLRALGGKPADGLGKPRFRGLSRPA